MSEGAQHGNDLHLSTPPLSVLHHDAHCGRQPAAVHAHPVARVHPSAHRGGLAWPELAHRCCWKRKRWQVSDACLDHPRRRRVLARRPAPAAPKLQPEYQPPRGCHRRRGRHQAPRLGQALEWQCAPACGIYARECDPSPSSLQSLRSHQRHACAGKAPQQCEPGHPRKSAPNGNVQAFWTSQRWCTPTSHPPRRLWCPTVHL